MLSAPMPMSVRVLASLVGLIAATLVAGILITLSALVSPSGGLMMPLGRIWSRVVLFTSGVRVEHEGTEHAAATPATPVLFLATHQSMLDVPAIAIAMPDTLRFVAKRALAWLPFFGWAMLATGGCIFIDRGDREGALRSLRLAGRRIREGHSVLVFPEGTRSPDGTLREFKRGPFHLAAEARVPIVPIVVEGTGRLMPVGALGARPGVVRVRFGAPLVVAASDTPATLSRRVRDALLSLGATPSGQPNARGNLRAP